MSRPTLEVADIIRAAGDSFWLRYGAQLAWPHRKVLDAIARCRTSALGGHRDECVRCGHQAISYNSCRSRHCPKCQGNVRLKWLRARSSELLPIPYFHVVFTLPHELSALALGNKRIIYDLLYHASSEAMLELARDPRYLGAHIGFLGVLHTWGQNLEHHAHIHYVVPAGGLAVDGSKWINGSERFFLPVVALSRVFRGKFTAALRSLYRAKKLQFHGSLQQVASPKGFHCFLQTLFTSDWVVYAKPPFGGPDQVLKYLARYTHRVAISNYRLLDFRDGQVSLLWRDYAHGAKQKVMTLSAHEFLRRFLLHVLPRGLVRIRHFGLFANRKRGAALAHCRLLLRAAACTDVSPLPQLRCPSCAGVMLIVERLSCAQLYFRMHTPAQTGTSYADSS